MVDVPTGPIVIQCCVCNKFKFTGKDGTVHWLARDEAIMPGFATVMATARLSHSYCKPCKESELERQGVTAEEKLDALGVMGW